MVLEGDVVLKDYNVTPLLLIWCFGEVLTLINCLPVIDLSSGLESLPENGNFFFPLQLRIARGSLHDVFFKISIRERMSYIAHSRDLARAKEAKRRNTRVSENCLHHFSHLLTH